MSNCFMIHFQTSAQSNIGNISQTSLGNEGSSDFQKSKLFLSDWNSTKELT